MQQLIITNWSSSYGIWHPFRLEVSTNGAIEDINRASSTTLENAVINLIWHVYVTSYTRVYVCVGHVIIYGQK